MKNVVKCPREFIAYFNALETTCVFTERCGPLQSIQFSPLVFFTLCELNDDGEGQFKALVANSKQREGEKTGFLTLAA
jgi:hypothetical protein